MYEKRSRRSRVFLISLVICCIVLLTASFGDAAGGALSAVQRGALEILVPIQEGAHLALKPVRDLAGWVGDTFHAKSKLKKLEAERNALRDAAINGEVAARENVQLRKMVKLNNGIGLDRYDPISAHVVGRSSGILSSTVNIDIGRSDGVRENQAVISEGLVGKVSKVAPHAAQVELLTDKAVAVSAKIAVSGVNGVVTRGAGDPNDIVLDFIAGNPKIIEGQRVITAGSQSNDLKSMFPPGIPIGEVSKVDLTELEAYQRVHIAPFADLRNLSIVQVLKDKNS